MYVTRSLSVGLIGLTLSHLVSLCVRLTVVEKYGYSPYKSVGLAPEVNKTHMILLINL